MRFEKSSRFGKVDTKPKIKSASRVGRSGAELGRHFLLEE